MSNNMEGGCFCGEVRYSISEEAQLQLFCFCEDCRRRSGTDGYAGYMVKAEAFSVTKGEPTIFEKVSKTGRKVKQNFCAKCGTNLWGETEFGLVSISAGTLDEPNRFNPTNVVFLDQAPAWARIPVELEEM